MRVRRLALGLTCLLVLPGTAAAQRQWDRAWSHPGPQPPAAAVEPQRTTTPLLGRAPDYRWEGLIIGAVALGLAAASLYSGLDADVGATLMGVAAGATAGAVIGGLIGTLFPKAPSARGTPE